MEENESSENLISSQNTNEVLQAFYQLSVTDKLVFIALDKSIEKITGFSVKDFLENKALFQQRIHPDQKASVLKAIKNAVLTDDGYEIEYRFKHKNGHYIGIRDFAKPVYHPEKESITFIGEITVVKTGIFNKMLDLIHAANVHGDIGVFYYIEDTKKSYWSKQLLKMHGIDIEPTREDYWKLVHPEDLEYCLVHFRKLMADHVGYKILYRIIRQTDGVIRQVISELVPVFNDNGVFSGVSGNTVDITEAMRMLSKEPQLLDERTDSNKYAEDDKILIKQNHSLVPVPVSDVIIVSAMRDYIQIYTKNRKVPYVLYKTLKDMYSALPENKFIQIHRSHIVRISEIKKINPSSVMIDEIELPISRSYKPDLKLRVNFTKK